jgi:hypothetical protein
MSSALALSHFPAASNYKTLCPLCVFCDTSWCTLLLWQWKHRSISGSPPHKLWNTSQKPVRLQGWEEAFISSYFYILLFSLSYCVSLLLGKCGRDLLRSATRTKVCLASRGPIYAANWMVWSWRSRTFWIRLLLNSSLGSIRENLTFDCHLC